jgi:hypothetical protein
MSEIMPVHLDQKVIRSVSGPSSALIVLLDGDLARRATTLAWRLGNTVMEWDAWLKSLREVEQAAPPSRRAIPFNPPSRDDTLLEAIVSGETMLANPMFQKLCVQLAPFVGTATVAQIRYELGKLLAAFPTKDELKAFAALLLEEVLSEQPSQLMLAMACREVRRNSKFRPSIAEVLEALDEVAWDADRLAKIIWLPKYVTALQKHLPEVKCLRPPEPTPLEQALTDCGCYVCGDHGGYYVVDGAKCFAGPFTTETEAWSWLEGHAVELYNNNCAEMRGRKSSTVVRSRGS